MAAWRNESARFADHEERWRKGNDGMKLIMYKHWNTWGSVDGLSRSSSAITISYANSSSTRGWRFPKKVDQRRKPESRDAEGEDELEIDDEVPGRGRR
jgi:hypothetical protein